MKFSLRPILLASLALTALTTAIPTPEPSKIEGQPDRVGARHTVEEKGKLVQRKFNLGAIAKDVGGILL